jgi:hypothetical protein
MIFESELVILAVLPGSVHWERFMKSPCNVLRAGLDFWKEGKISCFWWVSSSGSAL